MENREIQEGKCIKTKDYQASLTKLFKLNGNHVNKATISEGYPMCVWMVQNQTGMQPNSNSQASKVSPGPVMYSGLPVEWNPLCLVLTLTQLHRKFHHVDIELWSSSQSPSIQQQCKTPQAERVWVTESPSKYSTVTVSMTKSLPERYQQWVPSARLHRNDSPKPRTPRRGPQTCVIRYKIQLCRGWGGTLHCNTEGSWGSGP